MVLTHIVEAFLSFGIWLFLKIVPKEPADRYERIEMKSPNETRTRCVEFTGDVLSEVMQEATTWLREQDPRGFLNSFYALSIHSEYDGEIGWTITIVCGV